MVWYDRAYRACIMKITTNITEILRKHVVLSLELLDRVYLSAIQPRLQIEKNGASFFMSHRGTFFVKELAQMTRTFVAQVEPLPISRRYRWSSRTTPRCA